MSRRSVRDGLLSLLASLTVFLLIVLFFSPAGSRRGADMDVITPSPMPTPSPTPTESQANGYIGNKNSHVFHLPDCASVGKMKDKNKVPFELREEAVNAGYDPCQNCNP